MFWFDPQRAVRRMGALMHTKCERKKTRNEQKKNICSF